MSDVESTRKHLRELKVLYVEDNADSREIMLKLLQEYFDDVVTATDGIEAFELYREHPFDLIFSDIALPRLDGLELCGKIRRNNEEISLVILSAHREEHHFMNSLKIGVNGYLLKPIDPEQFEQLILGIGRKHRCRMESKASLHLLQTYQSVVNESSIVSKTDPRGVITFVNDAFCEISGYEREELLGKNHNIVRHPDNPSEIFKEMWHTIRKKRQPWKGIVRNRTKSGKSYYVDTLIMPILDLEGNIVEYISLRHVITDIMNPAMQLAQAVRNFRDPLLVYMRLEKFDIFEEFYDNDTMERLQDAIAVYLRNEFASRYDFDQLYRLGNGEFALILDRNAIFGGETEKILRELSDLQTRMKHEQLQHDAVGIDLSLLMSVAYEKNRILESAKQGIRRLRKSGRDFIVSNNLAALRQDKARKNMQMIGIIKEAIEDSKITAYFQPIVDNLSGQIVRYESLVRLIDREDRILSPAAFLETSKKSNLYTMITHIMLDRAFSVLRKSSFDITVNLSILDIEHDPTHRKILDLLEEYRDEASRVVFELLEEENVRNFDRIKCFVSEVKSRGVKIAIDDFGSGYSNYKRLLDYQPDILKIDGSLIRDIDTNTYARSIVKSIVTFAKEQRVKTVAEYIENESILHTVKNLEIDFSQGFHFGRPVPFAEVAGYGGICHERA